MSYVNKFYYINLDKRTDRKESVLAEARKAGITSKIERFKAIEGASYRLSLDEVRLFLLADYKNQPYTLNVIGNQLSHRQLLLKQIEDMAELICIFQDDVCLCDNFSEKLQQVIDNLPADAEIVNIGYLAGAVYSKSNNYQGLDIDGEQPAPEKITCPKIYGFKTPEKHTIGYINEEDPKIY